MLARLACFLGVVLLAASCRPPTQITLTLSSDLPCDGASGTTSVFVASSFAALPPDPGVETPTCASSGDPRAIGTLVLVPSADRSAELAIEVIAGVGRPSCAVSADGGMGADVAGCIFARRRLRFLPHTPLVLPIALRRRCIGVACGPDETCGADGNCQSAVCSDPACGDVSGPIDAGGGADGSPIVVDASASDGGTGDGAAASDGTGACSALSIGVDCAGAPGGSCGANNECCRRQSCIAVGSTACTGAPISVDVRQCDETGDCAAGEVCCGSTSPVGPTLTRCLTTCKGVIVCKQSCECASGQCIPGCLGGSTCDGVCPPT